MPRRLRSGVLALVLAFAGAAAPAAAKPKVELNEVGTFDKPTYVAAPEGSGDTAYVVEPVGEHVATVAAVDLGIKAMTPQRLAERGVRVHVLPSDATIEEVRATSNT